MSQPQAQPEYYVGQTDNIVDHWAQRTAQDCCAYLLPSLQPDMHILDVGCGPGSITLDLARHVPQGRVVGLDIAAAAPALQKARSRAAQEGIANATFDTGDGHALPYADATFDVAHSHQVLQSCRDPLQILRELRCVTKPGGFVAVRVWDSGSWIVHPPNDGVAAFRAMTGRVHAERGLGPYAGRNLHVWARQAGFDSSRVKITTSSWTFRTPGERAHIGGVMQAIGQESEFAQIALKKGYVTAEDPKKIRDGWQQWIDDEEGLSAVINFELLYHK
ncbi:UbiE family methyltransferase [Phanerochaete sordida]|uniref:UbiE family methyltransferase n=1 Tax=Phanerochaete sordida TaxID=48140 RepID=A0A9P3FXC0_9APHY|nr:UbiE family methyltransferase [Phanerochaete sordida]